METKSIAMLLAILSGLILFLSSVFVVNQTQQALILEFGKPIRKITTPGLKFKTPFLQETKIFDKKILNCAATANEIIAADQKRLIVDAFAKYRIVDILKFYQTVSDENGANDRLNAILDSAVRRVMGNYELISVLSEEKRGEIMRNIKDILTQDAKAFGIQIIDVRIMRADLPKENSEAIFARMETEREQEAKEIRAEGAKEAQKITAEAEKNRREIIATAIKNSEIVKGNADEKATRLYAIAFAKDPEFFSFFRSMIAYQNTFSHKKDTKMIMSSDHPFLKHMNR